MKKLILLYITLNITLFSFAQEENRYIEVEGIAKENVYADLILAELVFYNYDINHTSDRQLLEETIADIQRSLGIDKYIVNPDESELTTESNFGNTNLIFTQQSDYQKVTNLVEEIDADNVEVGIHITGFDVSDKLNEEVSNRLLTESIKNATSKAQFVAQTMNVELGDFIGFNEHIHHHEEGESGSCNHDPINSHIDYEKSVTMKFAVK